MKKIVHVCLAGSYNDGWTYHDNLLSEYHKELGHDVTLVTSPFVNDTDSDKYLFYKTGEYVNEFGIKIIRLPLKFSNSSKVMLKLRMYVGLERVLESEKPDIIFVHCGQFIDLKKVVNYVKRYNNVTLYIDNHADFSNSARTWFSYYIMHKCLWRSVIRKSIPYVKKYYGVLPARVEFLEQMYGIPSDKLELLVMGADDRMVAQALRPDTIDNTKKKYHIKRDDFVIATGGKIDRAKWQIMTLLKIINGENQRKYKLIFFGPIVEDMKNEVLRYVDENKILYVPWLDSAESYNLFAISDLAVFPGRHSVYWEQAVGQGVPIIVKRWRGTEHVDLGGNCIFLNSDEEEELKNKIAGIYDDRTLLKRMKSVAIDKGMNKFSYRMIAKKSIEMK